ncbi:MAG: thiosulfate oxidation carrier complex protein SoxZ [Pseudomonadota bacterium]
MAKARINIPRNVTAGDVIEIKTLITHPMETGFRVDSLGVRIPRNILTHFSVTFADQVVFEAELQPGIAANPYISFHLKAERGGTLTFTWRGQNDFSVTETRELAVAS